MPDIDYSLSDLARESGQSQRTIRFYIARGLLPGPLGAGRGARYGADHLDRLRRIAAMKSAGRTLAEIALELDDGEAPTLPEATALSAVTLSSDVQALVRADLPPWRTKQVRRILAETARQLRALEEQ